jgi:PhnB protein
VSIVVSGQVMPMIAVESVDAARDFYVDKLGFDHVMGMVGKDGQLDFVTVVLGGARVMFSRAPGADGAPARRAGKQPVEIYLQVDDVDGYHDQVKKKGVKISDPLTMQWWGDRTFKVLDPNGYEIWFYTHVAEAKPPRGAKLV